VTTTTTTRTQQFVSRLDSLVTRGDRAWLAALRRLTSTPDRWNADTFAAAMPMLPPGLHPNEEGWWLLVAGLHARWHQARSTPGHATGSFGASMRRLATQLSPDAEPADAVTRRFSVLLTATDERLTHHLRQAVTQLAAHDIAVDFSRLLDDLRHWDHPDRYVQRHWARDFWTPHASTDPTSTATTDSEASP